MDKYIGKELDKRYEEFKADPESKRTKAVIDLVLQAYLPENTNSRPEKLDSEFRAFAISHIRLFVFVGHDSTSSTICYILHLLATNPCALARVRAEHDKVLGPDLHAVQSLLKEHAHLTNHLAYTTTVTKEALRLFPPGGCSRAGSRSVDLIDDQGNRCLTKDIAAVRPYDFLPERWLAEGSGELEPMKEAYRAFETGLRNCVAQGFVMTELRVTMACIIRQFDFTPSYEEWDRLHLGPGLRTYMGERVYQTQGGAAHPVEDCPFRVSIRETWTFKRANALLAIRSRRRPWEAEKAIAAFGLTKCEEPTKQNLSQSQLSLQVQIFVAWGRLSGTATRTREGRLVTSPGSWAKVLHPSPLLNSEARTIRLQHLSKRLKTS